MVALGSAKDGGVYIFYTPHIRYSLGNENTVPSRTPAEGQRWAMVFRLAEFQDLLY